MKTVSFTKMENGTAEDYAILAKHEDEFCKALPYRIIGALENLRNSFSGYKIDRLEHSLQTATRAENGGADIDWIVSSLLHDLGDDLAPLNHDSLAAAIIKPYVRAECSWVVHHHGIFQLAYYGDKIGEDPEQRQKYENHPSYEAAIWFCEHWDQASFDPSYTTRPLTYFAPMVYKVFTRKPWNEDVIREGFHTKFITE